MCICSHTITVSCQFSCIQNAHFISSCILQMTFPNYATQFIHHTLDMLLVAAQVCCQRSIIRFQRCCCIVICTAHAFEIMRLMHSAFANGTAALTLQGWMNLGNLPASFIKCCFLHVVICDGANGKMTRKSVGWWMTHMMTLFERHVMHFSVCEQRENWKKTEK